MSEISKPYKYQMPSYPFRINSNERISKFVPLKLYEIDKNDTEAPIEYYNGGGLDPILFLTTEESNPIDLYDPYIFIDYPREPLGAYISIEAREANFNLPEGIKTFLIFTLKLPKPLVISKILLIGNLLIPPLFDERQPISNFGLPRDLRIYSVENWSEDLWYGSRMPREWKEVYNNREFQGLWGPTPININPTYCSHLIFVMNDLPILYSKYDKKQLYYVHGVSIKRLSVYEYEKGINKSRNVNYTPVSTWQEKYDSDDFTSRYWNFRGINPVKQHLHPSIYSELIDKKNCVDLLPSALIGLPSHHLISSDVNFNYEYREYYSGELTILKNNSTNLVLKIIEDNCPFLDGIQLCEERPRRVDNIFSEREYPDSVLKIYYTDDPKAAYSPNAFIDKWIFLMEVPFAYAFEPVGLKINFPYPINARYYRLEHRITRKNDGSARRFEIKKLEILRSKHMPLTACKQEIYQLESIQLRLMGNNLLGDYGFINGEHIMDLTFEAALKDQPFRPILTIRNLLDIREKTRCQIFANTRATRAYYQEFHEKGMQGDHIIDTEVSRFGTEAHTRNQQIIDPTSLQHVLNVSKQSMMVDAESQSSDPRVNVPGSKPANLIKNLKGVTTDRNARMDEAGKTQDILVRNCLKYAADILDMKWKDLKKLLELACEWRNDNISELFGLKSIYEALKVLKNEIKELPTELALKLQSLLSGDGIDIPDIPGMSGGGDDESDESGGLVGITSGKIPAIPCLTIDDNVNIIQEYINKFAPIINDDNIIYRPSVSLSGTFGGQFFGGGSVGMSMQLDGGKSTSKSVGSQGNVNETLTYYQYGNNIISDSEVIGSTNSRYSQRNHLYERDKEYIWKGIENRFQGKPVDIILMTIPVKRTIYPLKESVSKLDNFRIRIGYLPENVSLDVTFIGTAIPVQKKNR